MVTMALAEDSCDSRLEDGLEGDPGASYAPVRVSS